MRRLINIQVLRDAVVRDLVAIPRDRKHSSPEHAEPQAIGDEFYADCISTIVFDVLRSYGFHRLHSQGEQANAATFGKLQENGAAQVVQVRWRRNADLFSPYRDINEVEVPVFPAKNVGCFMHLVVK